jgi:hypothetical protein
MSSSTAVAVTRAPKSPAIAMHLSITAIAAPLGSLTNGNKISMIAMVLSFGHDDRRSHATIVVASNS